MLLLLYVISPRLIKVNNDNSISVLKKVEDKYDWTGINFPASYDDIATFEELNKICIFVYTISPENQIIKDKDGNGKYIANRVALLRIEDEEGNSHYVYIKHTDRLLNAHTHACDTGKRDMLIL
jgi:hypothetical protein